MSQDFVYFPNQAFEDSRLTLIEIRVLAALYSYWDRKTKKPIRPSREALAGRSGYQPRTVSKGIAGLVKKGWVTRRQHRGPNTYELHAPDLAESGASRLTQRVTGAQL